MLKKRLVVTQKFQMHPGAAWTGCVVENVSPQQKCLKAEGMGLRLGIRHLDGICGGNIVTQRMNGN